MSHRDPIERAFGLLRRQHGAELPPVALESKLRSLFERRRRRRLSPALLAVVALLLGGVTLAAPGAIAWLRAWWFTVEVDGRRITGSVDGVGERSMTFATADGGTAEVRVRRDTTAGGGARTRIAVDRDGPEGRERERHEDVVGGSGGERRLPLATVDGHVPIYERRGADGRGCAVYVVPDAEGGSRVFVHRIGDGDRPIEQIARVPLPLLQDGARAEISERADGSLSLSFDSAGGASFELVWAGDGPLPPAGGSELTTADGKIRVRVDDLPDSGGR